MRARTAAVLAMLGLAAIATARAQDAAPKGAPQEKVPAKPEPTPEDLSRKLEGVLEDLAKRLGAVKTLRCRFEQRKYLAVFDDVVTSQGTLALAVPDKLRWEYVKPLKSVLTVDGRRAQRERTSRKGETTRRAYSLDDEPVTEITTRQVFLWTRGEFAKARKGYDLALVTEKPIVVRAVPKDRRVKDVVASIGLTFSDDRRMLTGVTLVEAGEARTEITFQDVEIDPPLDDALFKIEK
jgi:outer membrane lipoprotein-sorting protein